MGACVEQDERALAAVAVIVDAGLMTLEVKHSLHAVAGKHCYSSERR